jgi:hypothetical protein
VARDTTEAVSQPPRTPFVGSKLQEPLFGIAQPTDGLQDGNGKPTPLLWKASAAVVLDNVRRCKGLSKTGDEASELEPWVLQSHSTFSVAKMNAASESIPFHGESSIYLKAAGPSAAATDESFFP